MNTVCSSPPVISVLLLPIFPMTFGAMEPPTTVPMPSTPKDRPAASAEKPRTSWR